MRASQHYLEELVDPKATSAYLQQLQAMQTWARRRVRRPALWGDAQPTPLERRLAMSGERLEQRRCARPPAPARAAPEPAP
jgi:hypothetical protein